MVANAFEIKSKDANVRFKDSGDIANWALNPIASATQTEIINGYPDNTFKPSSDITRAEMFAVVSNVLSLKK